MMAAELTFAGLDERSAEGASSGASRPAEADVEGRDEKAGPERGASPEAEEASSDELEDDASGPHLVLDEPSSLGSSMSTNVSEPPAARRSTLLMAATVVAALGVGYAAYALIGEERPPEPGGEPSATSPAPEPPPPTTAVVPAPSSTASATASSEAARPPEPPPAVGPKPRPVVRPKPVVVPPPTASVTADPVPEDDGPPTWFPEKGPEDRAPP